MLPALRFYRWWSDIEGYTGIVFNLPSLGEEDKGFHLVVRVCLSWEVEL